MEPGWSPSSNFPKPSGFQTYTYIFYSNPQLDMIFYSDPQLHMIHIYVSESKIFKSTITLSAVHRYFLIKQWLFATCRIVRQLPGSDPQFEKGCSAPRVLSIPPRSLFQVRAGLIPVVSQPTSSVHREFWGMRGWDVSSQRVCSWECTSSQVSADFTVLRNTAFCL